MHLGMICPEMTGHLNPMTTLGRELNQRGHQVSFLVGPRAYERVARTGLDVVPCGEAADAGGFRHWQASPARTPESC